MTWGHRPRHQRHPSRAKGPPQEGHAGHRARFGSCLNAGRGFPPIGYRHASRDHMRARGHRPGETGRLGREGRGEECARNRRHDHSDGSGVDAGRDRTRSGRWESRNWETPCRPVEVSNGSLKKTAGLRELTFQWSLVGKPVT